MRKHTETPWKTEERGTSWDLITDDGAWIATIHGGYEQDEANKNHIVHCVNELSAYN